MGSTSIRYGNRLADAGAVASIGSVGDSYDNALAESTIGLYKAECIHFEGPWRNVDDVELATMTWVGSGGSTSTGCTPPSATSHPSSSRTPTTVPSTPNSSRCRENPPSTEDGALQSDNGNRSRNRPNTASSSKKMVRQTTLRIELATMLRHQSSEPINPSQQPDSRTRIPTNCNTV